MYCTFSRLQVQRYCLRAVRGGAIAQNLLQPGIFFSRKAARYGTCFRRVRVISQNFLENVCC